MLEDLEAALDNAATKEGGHKVLLLLSGALSCGSLLAIFPSSIATTVKEVIEPGARVALGRVFQTAATQIAIFTAHAQERTQVIIDGLVKKHVLTQAEADAACNPLLQDVIATAKAVVEKLNSYKKGLTGLAFSIATPRFSLTDIATDLSLLHMTHDSLMAVYNMLEMSGVSNDDEPLTRSARRNLRDRVADIFLKCRRQHVELGGGGIWY